MGVANRSRSYLVKMVHIQCKYAIIYETVVSALSYMVIMEAIIRPSLNVFHESQIIFGMFRDGHR